MSSSFFYFLFFFYFSSYWLSAEVQTFTSFFFFIGCCCSVLLSVSPMEKKSTFLSLKNGPFSSPFSALFFYLVFPFFIA